jgi:lysophospholipid acyltransferase (LPLAT)-like uncharacterized protein
MMMLLLRDVGAWLGAAVVLLLWLTCRVRFHNDHRPTLRRQGKPYAYAFLHAHQIATVVAAERGTGAMVSRSADGEALIPSLRVRGVVPVRGSTRSGGLTKGGADALAALVEFSRPGAPVYFAVDGPRGPRNRVRPGVARLAIDAGAVVLAAVAIPSRRLILSRSWDRFQIPYPFARIDVFFAEPTVPSDREDVEGLRARISTRLDALEARHDPTEARHPQRQLAIHIAAGAATL